MEEVSKSGMVHARNKHIVVIRSYMDEKQVRVESKGKVGVYIVENKKTGELYIGSTVDKQGTGFNKRYREHFKRTGKLSNKGLIEAMAREGRENFIFHIVLEEELSKDDKQFERVRKAELELVEKERPAYNVNAPILAKGM